MAAAGSVVDIHHLAKLRLEYEASQGISSATSKSTVDKKTKKKKKTKGKGRGKIRNSLVEDIRDGLAEMLSDLQKGEKAGDPPAEFTAAEITDEHGWTLIHYIAAFGTVAQLEKAVALSIFQEGGTCYCCFHALTREGSKNRSPIAVAAEYNTTDMCHALMKLDVYPEDEEGSEVNLDSRSGCGGSATPASVSTALAAQGLTSQFEVVAGYLGREFAEKVQGLVKELEGNGEHDPATCFKRLELIRLTVGSVTETNSKFQASIEKMRKQAGQEITLILTELAGNKAPGKIESKDGSIEFDITATDDGGWTLLHYIAAFGNEEQLEAVLNLPQCKACFKKTTAGESLLELSRAYNDPATASSLAITIMQVENAAATPSAVAISGSGAGGSDVAGNRNFANLYHLRKCYLRYTAGDAGSPELSEVKVKIDAILARVHKNIQAIIKALRVRAESSDTNPDAADSVSARTTFGDIKPVTGDGWNLIHYIAAFGTPENLAEATALPVFQAGGEGHACFAGVTKKKWGPVLVAANYNTKEMYHTLAALPVYAAESSEPQPASPEGGVDLDGLLKLRVGKPPRFESVLAKTIAHIMQEHQAGGLSEATQVSLNAQHDPTGLSFLHFVVTGGAVRQLEEILALPLYQLPDGESLVSMRIADPKDSAYQISLLYYPALNRQYAKVRALVNHPALAPGILNEETFQRSFPLAEVMLFIAAKAIDPAVHLLPEREMLSGEGVGTIFISDPRELRLSYLRLAVLQGDTKLVNALLSSDVAIAKYRLVTLIEAVVAAEAMAVATASKSKESSHYSNIAATILAAAQRIIPGQPVASEPEPVAGAGGAVLEGNKLVCNVEIFARILAEAKQLGCEEVAASYLEKAASGLLDSYDKACKMAHQLGISVLNATIDFYELHILCTASNVPTKRRKNFLEYIQGQVNDNLKKIVTGRHAAVEGYLTKKDALDWQFLDYAVRYGEVGLLDNALTVLGDILNGQFTAERLQAKGPDGLTLLARAAQAGCLSLVQQLLKAPLAQAHTIGNLVSAAKQASNAELAPEMKDAITGCIEKAKQQALARIKANQQLAALALPPEQKEAVQKQLVEAGLQAEQTLVALQAQHAAVDEKIEAACAELQAKLTPLKHAVDTAEKHAGGVAKLKQQIRQEKAKFERLAEAYDTLTGTELPDLPDEPVFSGESVAIECLGPQDFTHVDVPITDASVVAEQIKQALSDTPSDAGAGGETVADFSGIVESFLAPLLAAQTELRGQLEQANRYDELLAEHNVLVERLRQLAEGDGYPADESYKKRLSNYKKEQLKPACQRAINALCAAVEEKLGLARTNLKAFMTQVDSALQEMGEGVAACQERAEQLMARGKLCESIENARITLQETRSDYLTFVKTHGITATDVAEPVLAKTAGQAAEGIEAPAEKLQVTAPAPLHFDCLTGVVPKARLTGIDAYNTELETAISNYSYYEMQYASYSKSYAALQRNQAISYPAYAGESVAELKAYRRALVAASAQYRKLKTAASELQKLKEVTPGLVERISAIKADTERLKSDIILQEAAKQVLLNNIATLQQWRKVVTLRQQIDALRAELGQEPLKSMDYDNTALLTADDTTGITVPAVMHVTDIVENVCAAFHVELDQYEMSAETRSALNKAVTQFNQQRAALQRLVEQHPALQQAHADMLAVVEEFGAYHNNSSPENDVSVLEQMLTDLLQARVKEHQAHAETRRHKAAVAGKDTQIANLTVQLGTASDSATDRAAELAAARAKITELKAQVDEANTRATNAEAQLQKVKATQEARDATGQQVADLTSQLAAATEEIKRLKLIEHGMDVVVDERKALRIQGLARSFTPTSAWEQERYQKLMCAFEMVFDKVAEVEKRLGAASVGVAVVGLVAHHQLWQLPGDTLKLQVSVPGSEAVLGESLCPMMSCGGMQIEIEFVTPAEFDKPPPDGFSCWTDSKWLLCSPDRAEPFIGNESIWFHPEKIRAEGCHFTVEQSVADILPMATKQFPADAAQAKQAFIKMLADRLADILLVYGWSKILPSAGLSLADSAKAFLVDAMKLKTDVLTGVFTAFGCRSITEKMLFATAMYHVVHTDKLLEPDIYECKLFPLLKESGEALKAEEAVLTRKLTMPVAHPMAPPPPPAAYYPLQGVFTTAGIPPAHPPMSRGAGGGGSGHVLGQ